MFDGRQCVGVSICVCEQQLGFSLSDYITVGNWSARSC